MPSISNFRISRTGAIYFEYANPVGGTPLVVRDIILSHQGVLIGAFIVAQNNGVAGIGAVGTFGLQQHIGLNLEPATGQIGDLTNQVIDQSVVLTGVAGTAGVGSATISNGTTYYKLLEDGSHWLLATGDHWLTEQAPPYLLLEDGGLWLLETGGYIELED